VEHIFGSLFEVSVFGVSWKWKFLWEKIDFEKIALTVCVFKVAFVTAVMFKGWSDVPADFAVDTESLSDVGRNMCDDASTEGGDGSAIEVIVSKERGMGRKRRVNAR